jgi:acetyl esterase/lipase
LISKTTLTCLGVLANVATSAFGEAPKKPVLPPAPEGVTIEQDVAYLAPGREEKLDLYLPANRPLGVRSPAVVIIHGGGWTAGDKAAGREFSIGTDLAKIGYVCASINYCLTEGHNWPTQLYDCKNAVRFLRANARRYHIDPDHIGVIGGSAGGHLSLMVAYTSRVAEFEPKEPYPGISDQVQAVVDLYGLTNIFTWKKTDEQGNPTGKRTTKNHFVGGTARSNPEGWRMGSPVYHVSKDVPPTLIIHGKLDTTIDRDQAIELASKLQEAGVEHELILLEGIGHTFDLHTWNHKPLPVDVYSAVVSFFDRHLKQK